MTTAREECPHTGFSSLHLSNKERQAFEDRAGELGFEKLSDYFLALHRMLEDEYSKNDPLDDYPNLFPISGIRDFYATDQGDILCGDARSFLFNKAKPNSVDLIMTSPPFGLVRKKSYGNEDADLYCDWFRSFAEGFKRVLKDNGSLVIDIGGAWVKGKPTRSLYHFKLLIMLVEEFGFHLCQEHYWWNPSKLPTPAEWVNIRRVRVKDAVNCVWWLSKSPYPRANNKRVIQPYSSSMKNLIKNGYVAQRRPSGHVLSDKFSRDNGGSVPPNLLAIANTESNGQYQDYCRAEKVAIHPARFPSALPEYFIRFLTDPGDYVVDPFAGSCMTGAVAEALNRKWTCCDLSEEYLVGGKARFVPSVQPLGKRSDISYGIAPPCALSVADEEAPLIQDGGRTRLAKKRPD